jgi:hypothetical protein
MAKTATEATLMPTSKVISKGASHRGDLEGASHPGVIEGASHQLGLEVQRT